MVSRIFTSWNQLERWFRDVDGLRIKKAEKTPTGEIDLSLQRAKELKP